jgi:hypothetical protein
MVVGASFRGSGSAAATPEITLVQMSHHTLLHRDYRLTSLQTQKALQILKPNRGRFSRCIRFRTAAH